MGGVIGGNKMKWLIILLRQATLCLGQATHRGQDGNQMSADPSYV